MRPAGPRSGLFRGTVQSIRDVLSHRELLGLLVRREIKARYKDSILGFFWSLARPLALLAVYWLAIGKFLGAERSIPEFAIYIFTGLTAWQLFADIVLTGTGSVVANSGLIKKVYVPREVFPLSVVGSSLFNFGIQLGILVLFTAIRGQFPTGERWLYFLLGFTVLVTFATALALILSAVNVYLRDVQYLVEIVLMLAFWMSPIVYSWSQITSQVESTVVQNIYASNPMTQVIFAFQRAFWVAGDGQPMPDYLGVRLLITLGFSIVLLWIGQRVFARLQSNFAQEL
ncbi:ABC transporter permease [Oerskovia sp. NPDC060287]|uniref:ABC transporter permease n=1 Tax=Oerskovia sp. NPDC060287 TaxID=3347095 RepID=UPI003669D8FA